MDNSSFSTYLIHNHRVTVKDFEDKSLSLEVVNSQLTKKYNSGNIKLNNINLNALKTGLNKSNPSIKIQFTEAQNSIQLKIIIHMPLLPLVIEIINCPFLSQLNENNQNNMILTQIANTLTQTKQIIGNIQQRYLNTKNNLISFMELQKRLYDQKSDYLDNQQQDQEENYLNHEQYNYQGILLLGKLNFISKAKYLITLSFFGKGIGQLSFYYGDISTPIQIFNNFTDSTVHGQIQQYTYGFYSYSFRDIVSIHDTSQTFKIMAFDDGLGTQFRNIILTATEIK